ncbi:MAG TPA: glycosyltransferase family 2 protein [Cyclobacteriaceae bacterium]|nr:glycosyltransferase family 2 protein [Cyclobacteriaceae bacterium]
MKQPLVSIITVNYNGVNLTLEFLHSLRQVTYPNFELIVVDNGSLEDPSPIIAAFPEVKLIKSKKNLGFAGGNNLGIAEAKGKYLLFLNNDTEVVPAFIEPLVEVFENNPNAGVASPKILFFNSQDKKTIQYAGSTGINPYTIRGETIGSFDIDQNQYAEVRETSLGHGAAMMVPMKVASEVGLIPDIYFLYYEEHDWVERIKMAGYKVYYVGTSTVYHKESMTVGPNSALRTYYMTRGRLLYTRRITKGIQRFSSLLFFVSFSFPKNFLTHLLKGEFRLLKAFLMGAFWHVNNHDIDKMPRLVVDKGEKPRVVNTSPHTPKKFA